ncbi:MAG: uncharacterized protein A8A55_1725 [Amphiamblys sp. WSBS2006]|nr:MAG: uncharacterized protein A8A55_1725 [Amphiamblys sp. WSBS2006]
MCPFYFADSPQNNTVLLPANTETWEAVACLFCPAKEPKVSAKHTAQTFPTPRRYKRKALAKPSILNMFPKVCLSTTRSTKYTGYSFPRKKHVQTRSQPSVRCSQNRTNLLCFDERGRLSKQ